MKVSHNHLDRSWAEERIEDYVDGLLARRDRKTFERMLAVDEDLERHVDLARRVRDSLRSFDTPSCPPSVYEPVLERARREAQGERRPAAIDWRGALLRPQAATVRLIVVVSVMIAAVFTAVVVIDREAGPTVPGDEEVRAALDEVKLALSYVSIAGRETGSTIRHRAVDENIIDPVVRAIGHADIGSGAGTTRSGASAELRDAKTRGKS